jgi:large subunit ribosomal protein L15
VKILGRGELKSAVSISAHKFTKSAEEAISKAGGKAITLIKQMKGFIQTLKNI